jgi:lipopolysaccharide biosynthesis glycosyltransferase
MANPRGLHGVVSRRRILGTVAVGFIFTWLWTGEYTIFTLQDSTLKVDDAVSAELWTYSHHAFNLTVEAQLALSLLRADCTELPTTIDLKTYGYRYTHAICSSQLKGGKPNTVVTAVDDDVLHYLPTFINALASSNSHNSIRLVVLGVDIIKEEFGRLCKLRKHLWPAVAIEYFNIPSKALLQLSSYNNRSSMRTSKHFPVVKMAKLIAPLILPADIKTAVYLDVDTLVISDISSLMSASVCRPLRGKTFLDVGICARSSLRDNLSIWFESPDQCVPQSSLQYGQFNADVLLLNITKMRAMRVPDAAITLASTLGLDDQAILNLIYKGQQLDLPAEYNVLISQHNHTVAKSQWKILRISGKDKPWFNPAYPWHEYWSKYNVPGFIFVWSSLTKPLPQHALAAIRSTAENSQGRAVTVYCSTRQCYETIAREIFPVVPRFIRIRDLMAMDSPLSMWFQNRTIHKIWSGPLFPTYLQRAAQLQLLYWHGGVLMDFNVSLAQPAPPAVFQDPNPWCLDLMHSAVSYAPPRDAKVRAVLQQFVDDFPAYTYNSTAWPLVWKSDWEDKCAYLDWKRWPWERLPAARSLFKGEEFFHSCCMQFVPCSLSPGGGCLHLAEEVVASPLTAGIFLKTFCFCVMIPFVCDTPKHFLLPLPFCCRGDRGYRRRGTS